MDDLAVRLKRLESLGIRCHIADANDGAEAVLVDEEIVIENAKESMRPPLPKMPTAKPQKTGPSVSVVNLETVEELKNQGFPEFSNIKAKESCPDDLHLAPWNLVRQYPEKFIGKMNRPLAAKYFEREEIGSVLWDLFYIHIPKKPTQDPIIWVPTVEVERFLSIINASLGILLTIPGGRNEQLFNVKFGIGGQLKPRYLERSKNWSKFQLLIDNVPPFTNYDLVKNATQDDLDDLYEKLSFARFPSKAEMGKRAAQRAEKRAESRQLALEETQSHLGLRKLAEGRGLQNTEAAKLDPTVPPPYAPERSVVFVSIDIESMEEYKKIITEVGISVLDTNDIIGVAPGDGGENWFSLIKARHLLIREYATFRNTRFVHGCPDRFGFGESEVVAQADVKRLVEDVLFEYSDRTRNGDRLIADKQYRDIIIVGHGVSSDINYLQEMGVELMAAFNFFRSIDTKDLHQAWRHLHDGRSLAYLLSDLNISFKDLHNAGNDAAYTLQAMIALAVRAAARTSLDDEWEA